MSAGYKDYAHASLAIVNKFRWEKIALVVEGKFCTHLLLFPVISEWSVCKLALGS